MSPQVPAGSSFPAADPGFAALPVAELLASAEDLIARIRLCFGIDRGSFDSDVQPLLHRYAAYVHLLPATADNYFSAPGGLLRLGLEVAFFSLQGTDAHIFSGRSTISARRQLEPRWRQATFIGGLCCELHRVLSHVIVTDAGGDEWPAYLTPWPTGSRGVAPIATSCGGGRTPSSPAVWASLPCRMWCRRPRCSS
jgi:conjugal transfer pilus assembly protein TraI